MFEELYSDPARLEQFMGAMTGAFAEQISTAFAEKFDFSGYKTLCDVGGATGILSMHGRAAAPTFPMHHRSIYRWWSRSPGTASKRAGLSDRVEARLWGLLQGHATRRLT